MLKTCPECEHLVRDKANVNKYALKGLVGHHISDVTENVYTDRPITWLRKEIKKNKMSCRNDVISVNIIYA